MIKNGKDTTLDFQQGNLPNVGSVLLGWMQRMTVLRITKEVVNHVLKETAQSVTFHGVMQTMGAEELKMKPEGQWAWSWNTLHAEPSLVLNLDEVIIYQGKAYRIKSKTDYAMYGYVKYDMVEDYENGSPEVVE